MSACSSLILIALITGPQALATGDLLNSIERSDQDALLVVEQNPAGGEDVLLRWQEKKPLIPASLTKLVTAYLALQKWNADHRFVTDFYQYGNQLWVKGFGDPMLTSEELDRLAATLRDRLTPPIKRIVIDASWFANTSPPWRSRAVDPYNAPVSAVAANFNTVYLEETGSGLVSAEAQTPLTELGHELAASMRVKKERINVGTKNNAQRYFAELLAAKLGLKNVEFQINAQLDAALGEPSQTLGTGVIKAYQHENSQTLASALTGSLRYSNNFIANQLFLNLAAEQDSDSVNFKQAAKLAQSQLRQAFGWREFKLVEGAGLARENRMSASQIDDVLDSLRPHKALLKKTKKAPLGATVWAKTGTLDGVRSYAGFIEFDELEGAPSYRFVFIFNRKLPFAYRETVLDQLILELRQRADQSIARGR